MLGICSTLGKSPMNRSVFKHGYWAASGGIAKPRSRKPTTISILFPTKTMMHFFWPNLFHQRAPFVTFSDVQKGHASIWTYAQSMLGICSTIEKSWVGVFLNMATELPPGDCKAKEPQLYPYFFRPEPWCIFSDHISFIRQRLLQHFRCSERECIIWTYFQSTLGICSTIGKSPMNRTAFKHGYWAAPRGLQSQGVRSHNDIHTASDHWSHLYH